MAIEILFLLLLILLNGVFAMAEIAIVSARKARLQQAAEEGDAGAQAALELANAPGRFLSTVQIGITLVGIFAGAFGGATLAEQLAAGLEKSPLLRPYSDLLSVGLVVLAITYLTLVLGELAPKRIGLANAERVAAGMARPMRQLSKIASPLVRLLTWSTETVLRLLRIRPSDERPVTEEEIRILIQQGTQTGVFAPIEKMMVEHVFRLGDQKISALFTPRTEMIWLDIDEPAEVLQRKIKAGFSRFPVARGSLDEVLGWVLTKDLLAQSISGQDLDLASVVRPPMFVPESLPALVVLEWFKETRNKAAFVVDEYGGLQGMVTVYDILEAVVGDLPDADEPAEVVQREDGSWLLDGRLPIAEFMDLFGIKELPGGERSHYQTLGGMVMTFLRRVPTAGDLFEWNGLRFEVMDMDGRRVDKMLLTPIKTKEKES